MMSKRSGLLAFRLGVSFGAIISLIKQNSPLLLKIWEKPLVKRYGKIKAKAMLAEIKKEYAKLQASVPLPPEFPLRYHRTVMILPGIAVYKTILKDTPNRREALAEAEILFKEIFGPQLYRLFRYTLSFP
jgi:hypothetical protein